MTYGGKLLSAFLFLLTIAYVLIALTYSRTPRMFPLLVGVPMILLTGFQMLIDLFPKISKKYSELGALDAEQISGKVKVSGNGQSATEARRNLKELEIFLWLGVAVGLMLLVGIFMGIPVFIFIFLKFRYSRGWKLSLGLPLGTMLVIYIIFIKVLTIPLYNGIFFS